MASKSELRQLYLQKRRNLQTEEIEKLSLAIARNFMQLQLDEVNTVHMFYPITGKQEFNTLLLKERLLDKNPELRFVLPKVNLANNTLTNILWDNDTPLAMNEWGITEPEHGREVSSADIDLVIIPLLAYDKQGNRLGYGKGFYDRFLSLCRTDVKKIGVSYFEPEDQLEELGMYDIPLDFCVTPLKVWSFRKSD